MLCSSSPRAFQCSRAACACSLSEPAFRLLGHPIVGQRVAGISAWELPGLSYIPVLGPALFCQDWLVYLAVFLAIALWYVLFRTDWGLLVRASARTRKSRVRRAFR